MSSFQRDPNYMTEKPRRVRGGVRLSAKSFPLTPGNHAARRWLDVIGRCAAEADLRDGFEYARAGQARSFTVEPGKLIASVQGRAIRAYKVVLACKPLTHTQWESVVSAVGQHPLAASRLLAGEVTEEVEALFASLSLPLFPEPADFDLMCAAPNEKPWCKHMCCAAILLADALERKPGLILTLRGLEADELLERVRDLRAASSGGSGIPGVAGAGIPTTSGGALDQDQQSPPLESQIDEFWEAGPTLRDVETPIKPPDVSHPLLRRLGPSPFTDGKFPLVGLLATCYDTISKSAIDGAAPPNGSSTDPVD